MFALWAPEAPKTDPVALYVQRDAHADRSHGYSSQGEARPLWVAVCARSARPYKRPTPYASETFRMDTHTRPELRICDIRRLSKERCGMQRSQRSQRSHRAVAGGALSSGEERRPGRAHSTRVSELTRVSVFECEHYFLH